jgi:ABC-type lipoprotein release transport system permease subunit
MALGASPGGVLREALRSGLAPAVAGLVAGLLAALAAARVITSLLYDVRAVDLAMCATVAALLLGVATLASWLPARRAARANPLTVLRAD